MEKLKDTVREKLGEDFKITEPKKIRPKIKVVNVGDEEMQLKDETLVDTIKKQNTIDSRDEEFCIKIVKRMIKDKGGSLILDVDEMTHELILRKDKINIGWRKCLVFDHYSVKRCFKCWGYYHIAKDCKRQETCNKCAGNHKASECRAKKMRCVNCMHKIKTYNLKINDEHDALSRKCPTFIRALEEEKKRTGWQTTK
ncbi:PREDICTED: uncharacterized protein LOC105453951 [Wasmannia auropunctata]|uniref:uncharacterized protein LOC105453951 n=1 Tax=Wasmannia auropunctata TaxID=64793 RepID=UPI0005F0621C|nr:PREDICTED: uncharacterized protein LOC105453951 [Wasmannia auropunctata]